MRISRESCSPLASLAAALFLGGCPATAEQVAPPQYSFYFPTGLALSPDERYLFVVNANSDLRYSAGSIQVIDLDQVDALADTWNGSNGTYAAPCKPFAARPKILSCKTTADDGSATSGMVGGSSVQIGSFGVSVALQPVAEGGAPSPKARAFATVRGDPSITWATFDSATGALDCGGTGDFPRCDEPHRLVRFRNDATLPSLSPEPFDIAIDPLNERAYASDLTSGHVTLMSAPRDIEKPPILEDAIGSLWALNTLTGTLGAVGVAPRLPGDPRGLVYVTSRSEARVSLVHAVDGPPDANGRPTATLVRTASFFYAGLTAQGDPGDARNLAFTPDGNRALLISRTPPALQVFDTSLDASGTPLNRPLGIIEVCAQAANLGVADFGEGARVALPCFSTGQVWVIDPETFSLVAVEDAGRGPSGVAVSARHKKIYVGNYAEDTVTIIDARPGSPTQHRAVLFLGTARNVQNPT
jgi:DNA-binding beta-propeller fold protein YncE